MPDKTSAAADGVHAMVPRDKMDPLARKLRDFYAVTPGAPLVHRPFYFFDETLERWYTEGLDRDADLNEVFGFDTGGMHVLWGLGWTEAAFDPAFEVKVVEDRGEHEVEQDFAGRLVLYFKGRRHGFMPEYIDHPVKDWKTWEENVKWRLDPTTQGRWNGPTDHMADAKANAARGWMIQQRTIGGYMYLRSLMGPEELLTAFYDMPDLIHDCMAVWLKLADAVTAWHQERVTIDELFLAEDICYNHGPLISPAMMNEFLIPYYQQLIANIKGRQLDKARHLYIQIDTDGLATPTIPVYTQGIGMDVMSPFEVASGCDVVEIGAHYSNLAMSGGIDKRILARDTPTIDRMLDHILPAMHARGGYYPTCDHAVPSEVSLANYMHYRKRCLEYNG